MLALLQHFVFELQIVLRTYKEPVKALDFSSEKSIQALMQIQFPIQFLQVTGSLKAKSGRCSQCNSWYFKKPNCYGGGGGLVAKSYLTLATPWTVACLASLSIGFPRQGYWSGLPFPSPGDLPPGNQTQVSCIAGRFFTD